MIEYGCALAIFGPIFNGYLLKGEWTRQGTYQSFTAIIVVAGIATMLLDRIYRKWSENREAPEAPMELSEPALSVKLAL
jgi:hypothetical protein